jgi:hypothetical protein
MFVYLLKNPHLHIIMPPQTPILSQQTKDKEQDAEDRSRGANLDKHGSREVWLSEIVQYEQRVNVWEAAERESHCRADCECATEAAMGEKRVLDMRILSVPDVQKRKHTGLT